MHALRPPFTTRPASLGAGMTLIEMLVVILLLGLLAMLAHRPALDALQARKSVADGLETLGQTRLATERIAREMRQIRSVDATVTPNVLQVVAMDAASATATSSPAVCFVRLSGGGGAQAPAETVLIRQVGASVQLGTAAASAFPGCTGATMHPLAADVSALRFEYWGADAAGAPTRIPAGQADFGAQVRRVVVGLTFLQGGEPLPERRLEVQLRNGPW